MTKFLTEPEVAEVLRCSTSKIKRLRLSGRLAYLPGRPVLIAEEALQAWIASATRASGEQPAGAERPRTPAQAEAQARHRARERWLRCGLARRQRPGIA